LQLHVLVGRAAQDLVAVDTLRIDPEPRLAATRVDLRLRPNCRPLAPHETERWVVEMHVAGAGLTCQWEGEDLVLALPGWTPPAPVIVAMQPGLFERLEDASLTAYKKRSNRKGWR
jgi:hypothetical protein